MDWNGIWNFTTYSDFVLNGGTLQNDGSVDFGTEYALLKKITLARNSSFAVPRSWGLINSGFGVITLGLGGHTLDVNVSSGKAICFTNVQVPGQGRIEAHGEGTFVVRDDRNGVGFVGSDVDLWASCELRIHGPMSVHDYEAAATKNGSNIGEGVLSVYGTFKPTTRYFRGVTMQDGSTMDFSEWPVDAGWPVANAYTCTGDKTIKFAEADDGATTTVTVKLGDRKVTGGKILSWAPDADVSRVKFVRGDADRSYTLDKRDDGLYAIQGFIIIFK